MQTTKQEEQAAKKKFRQVGERKDTSVQKTIVQGLDCKPKAIHSMHKYS